MTQQLKMVNLKCAGCGGSLEISGDMERFACGYCGSEQIVERRGGTIGLKLVVDAVARVQAGTDKTAAELALVRLDKELATARVCWEEADEQFCLRNPNSNSPAFVLLVTLPICFFGSLILFFYTLGDPGGMFMSILSAAGAFVGTIFAARGYLKAKERFYTGLSELSRFHEKQIQNLERQIAKHRLLIHS